MKRSSRLLTWLLILVFQASVTFSEPQKPVRPSVDLQMGLAALDSGQWESAFKIFEQLTQQQPDQPAPAYYLGVAASHGGHDVIAVDAFVHCASLDPTFPWVQANLGLTLFRLDEMELAEEHLLEALLQGPEDADVLLHLGMIDAQREEYDRALRLYKQSADLDPEISGISLLQSADAEFARGDFPAALNYLELASESPGPTTAKQTAETLLAQLAGESQKPPRFDLRASAGFELDDNVTVSEEDLATGLSDEALILNAGVNIYLLQKEKAWITLGYDLYQSLFRTLTDFDLRIQQPRITVGSTLGRFYPSLSYSYRDETLGSNGFLSSHELNFNVQIALIGGWSTLLGGQFESLTFDMTPERTGQLSYLNIGQQIRFFEDLISFLVVWEPSWQRTDGAAFSYDGQSINTQLSLTIPEARGMDVNLSYEYAMRDYINPSSGFSRGYRHDSLHVFWTSLRLPLSKFAEASINYLHIRSHSTLPSLNYSQNILNFRIGVWYY